MAVTFSRPPGAGGGTGGGVPDDGSVTDVKVATNAGISLDKTADTATRVAMLATERTKLSGIEAGALAQAAVDARIQLVVGAAPAALDTLTELAASINNDANYAGSVTTALSLKAPLNSPAFTGTPTGITKTHVGLPNVDNTADSAKPVSTTQQAALDLKADLNSPAFTGTPTGITKTHVGLANVNNTSDADKPVSTATAAELASAPVILIWTTVAQARPGTSRHVWWLGNVVDPPTNAVAGDIITRTSA